MASSLTFFLNAFFLLYFLGKSTPSDMLPNGQLDLSMKTGLHSGNEDIDDDVDTDDDKDDDGE